MRVPVYGPIIQQRPASSAGGPPARTFKNGFVALHVNDMTPPDFTPLQQPIIIASPPVFGPPQYSWKYDWGRRPH